MNSSFSAMIKHRSCQKEIVIILIWLVSGFVYVYFVLCFVYFCLRVRSLGGWVCKIVITRAVSFPDNKTVLKELSSKYMRTGIRPAILLSLSETDIFSKRKLGWWCLFLALHTQAMPQWKIAGAYCLMVNFWKNYFFLHNKNNSTTIWYKSTSPLL